MVLDIAQFHPAGLQQALDQIAGIASRGGQLTNMLGDIRVIHQLCADLVDLSGSQFFFDATLVMISETPSQ